MENCIENLNIIEFGPLELRKDISRRIAYKENQLSADNIFVKLYLGVTIPILIKPEIAREEV